MPKFINYVLVFYLLSWWVSVLLMDDFLLVNLFFLSVSFMVLLIVMVSHLRTTVYKTVYSEQVKQMKLRKNAKEKTLYLNEDGINNNYKLAQNSYLSQERKRRKSIANKQVFFAAERA